MVGEDADRSIRARTASSVCNACASSVGSKRQAGDPLCHGSRYRVSVSDDPFYRPSHRAPAPRQPKPGEPLWNLPHEHVAWSCDLRFHGESYGWETQILGEEELAIGWRFDLRRLAEQWAEEERQHIENGGA